MINYVEVLTQQWFCHTTNRSTCGISNKSSCCNHQTFESPNHKQDNFWHHYYAPRQLPKWHCNKLTKQITLNTIKSCCFSKLMEALEFLTVSVVTDSLSSANWNNSSIKSILNTHKLALPDHFFFSVGVWKTRILLFIDSQNLQAYKKRLFTASHKWSGSARPF